MNNPSAGLIATYAQIAGILESTANKPGNVYPKHDFSDTSYEDFIFGSNALKRGIKEAAADIKNRPEIGKLIKKCAIDVRDSHPNRGNTHLGTILLFVPIAVGVRKCISNKDYGFEGLSSIIKKIIENSTKADTKNFYEAIKISNAGGGLSEGLKEPDVTFYELMKLSKKTDRIAEELLTGLPICTSISKKLKNYFEKGMDIRNIITQVYLETLAEQTDTFIEKKLGKIISKKVSKNAKKVIDKGGVFTPKGRNAIKKFDEELRHGRDNELNPGTTADLVSAGIFLFFLKESGPGLLGHH